MTIRIGIVENEENDIRNATEILNEWSIKEKCKIDISIFNSGSFFLKNDFSLFQICFLDIKLDDMNGLEIAKYMRMNGYHHDIVFLTSFREYVFEGYNVRALNYLIKPVKYTQIAECMSVLLDKMKVDCYSYHYHNKFFQIPYSEILYFSSNNHITDIVCKSENYEQRESLKQIESFLPSQFQRCHRALLVNMEHVLKLIHKEIYLINGHVLPVSNTYLNSIQRAFIQKARDIYD